MKSCIAFSAILLCIAASATLCIAEETNVTILATTDLHGNIYPYDYFTGRPAERGLAKIATLIAEQRKSRPDALLVDCGDTIQGASLEGVYQQYVLTGKLPGAESSPKAKSFKLDGDPMMLAMNHLKYTAMAVGNHEFNFGLDNLESARKTAQFPWLSANTSVSPSGKGRAFQPYIVQNVNGVSVALIGITTPGVPGWEKPENYGAFRFKSAVESVRTAVNELRRKEKPDLIVVVAHMGLDRDMASGKLSSGNLPGENAIYQIATEVEGVDGIIYGHTHQELSEARINGVVLMQPRNWGMSLGRMDFVLEKDQAGGFKLLRKSGRTVPVDNSVAADPAILKIAEPYHEAAEAYLNAPVSETKLALSANTCRVEDTALIDAINQAQLDAAKADVSFTSCFNPRVQVPQGKVTMRQIAALYQFDNEAYAIEGTGAMVKAALENAARFYRSCANDACDDKSLINRAVLGYNYDMAAGVTYDIDLRRPEGDRIQNLQWKGRPLDPGQPLRIAVNNYRAAGSAGYSMFKDAKIAWRSYRGIPDLIIEYYGSRGLPQQPDKNWKIVPDQARAQLLKEAQAFGSRPQLQ